MECKQYMSATLRFNTKETSAIPWGVTSYMQMSGKYKDFVLGLAE
jgi:hypothetical protein